MSMDGEEVEKVVKLQTPDVFNCNEMLVKLVINKLITLTVRETHIAGINKRLNDYCCNYVEENIKNTVNLQYLKIDEEDEESERNLPKNTWVEIQQPSVALVDTYASTLIKSGSDQDDPDSNNKVIIEDAKAETRHKFETHTERNQRSKQHFFGKTEPVLPQKKERKEINIIPFDIIYTGDGDSEEIVELRQQKMIELTRLAIEKKRQQEIEEQEKATIAVKTNTKPFDFNKFTFDSNGCVIPKKKATKPDFLSKEFYWTKFDIKDIGVKKANKFVPIQRNSDVIHNVNPNDLLNIAKPTKEKKKERFKFQPSGSNFEIILPEIGVKITEEKKVKGGEKEFSKKYNRTSKADYERMLNESIPQLNASLIKSNMINTMISHNYNNSMLENSEFIPYTEGNASLEKSSYLNQSNQNPLLTGKENTKSKLLGMSRDYGAFNSSVGTNKPFYNTRLLTEDDMIMKMNKKLNSSLKIAMDSIMDLDLLKSNQRSNVTSREDDIFKNLTMRPDISLNRDAEEENIRYSKSIIKNKDWGKAQLKSVANTSSGNQTFSKPSQFGLIRELGIQIVNTKIPRSRKYNHVIKKL